MGRRRVGGSGGGGKPQSNSDRILRRHIEAAGKSYSTVEELVDHLRSSYPHYSRHKVRPFTKHVERVIMVSSSRSDAMDVSNDDGDTPTVRKRKKVDGKEEKLQLIEAEHVRRRNVSNNGEGGSSSSLASVSSSEGGDSCDEEASTSDDAVYGEKFEPEFDLMKSMVREGLRRKSKKLEEQSAAKEAVELEMNNESAKELNLMNEGPKLGCNLNKIDMNGNLNKIDMNVRSRRDENESYRPMFKDFGGMRAVIEELKMDIIVQMYNPQIPRELGVEPVAVAGILLHGPPGCGKTMLAHAIANETGVPFYKICATELVSGVSGASEENIRELFSKAYRTAPSILFIDEIDAIASKRENMQREMERRIVTQLMTCMSGSESSGHVLVIGATNRPDALDPALRRPGRFDREIVFGVPDEDDRAEILSALTSNLKVEGAFDLLKIARATPGFVGADLSALVKKTTILAMKRTIHMRKDELITKHGEEWWKQHWSHEDTEHIYITMTDFEEAVKLVQPSLKREGFSTIPNVKWDDVGGLHSLRQEFERSIVRQIKSPEKYENFGVDLETGFLLYGPPGCGKTLIAKAVANEAGANFIHIKGPELLNKYVGESELAVRTIFSRARTCSPCVLFFDEVDALTTERGKEGGGVVDRLVAQLLIELDGAEDRRGVYVIGATNRPEAMDRAMLRRGRFGMLMYVPLPSPEERGMIMKALAKKKPIDSSVDLIALGKDCRCDNLSGADLYALMNEAAMAALEDSCNATSTIKDEHFTSALKKISPSVSDKQIHHYKLLSERLKAK